MKAKVWTVSDFLNGSVKVTGKNVHVDVDKVYNKDLTYTYDVWVCGKNGETLASVSGLTDEGDVLDKIREFGIQFDCKIVG